MSISSSKATQPVTATSLPLPTGAAQDGADISAPTAMPAGGAGLRGWLSAIWTKLNGSLAVTGTFWQATQPVSLASLPALATGSNTVGAVTAPGGAALALDGTDITTPTAMPAGGAGIRGWLSAIWTKLNGTLAVTGTFFQATQPVSIASMPSTPVTGTFWQATQPVSAAALPLPAGAAADGTDATGVVMPTGGVGIRGWLSSIYNKLNTSVAVTGTFFQATQPVSMATNTPDITDRAARLLGVIASITGALPAGANLLGKVGIDQTTPGTTNLVQLGGSLPAGTNKVGTVDIATAAAVAKGTQGANGVPTQDLKDSGRSARTITLDSFAVAATAETLMTMSYSTDNGTLTTGTSYAVTAGKRFRVTAIMASLHTIAGNTTAVGVIVRLRVNNGGAALVSSPVQAVLPIQGVAAANQAGFPTFMDVPDGWEFIAGAGIGVTVACSGFVATTAAPKVDITIIGYEY